ncbi:MAG: radical SAM protein [Planctomycetota bacterium]|jgi:hypothetical protein
MYGKGTGHTAIHTHISPTAACNLDCAYCAYAGRCKSQSIALEVIQDYIEKLQSRGLKAVTITGGGEPALYQEINELIEWLHSRSLAIGLITNGTQSSHINCWNLLSWVRVSINRFPGWAASIRVPRNEMAPEATLGFSLVYQRQSRSELYLAMELLDLMDGDYLRVFPDYLLPLDERRQHYDEIEERLGGRRDGRVSVLRSYPRAPQCRSCHLSYFRPWLSEVDGGTVYLCCVAILRAADRRMRSEDRVCAAPDILKYLDGQIESNVIPEIDCEHCTYADTVEALAGWANGAPSGHDLFV